MRPYNNEALASTQFHGNSVTSGENSFGFVACKSGSGCTGYFPTREAALRELVKELRVLENQRGRGLGDMVKKALQKIGIDKDCDACEKRRRLLNRIRF